MAKNYENAQNKFRMPYGSDQLWVDTAGSFVAEAAPLEADFIARGMPTNFIADLTAKRGAFDAVLTNRRRRVWKESVSTRSLPSRSENAAPQSKTLIRLSK